MLLPRILYAVPPTLEKRLETAKAIRLLAAENEARRPRSTVAEAPVNIQEVTTGIVCETLRELRKAGFDPSEPRVPAGNPDGGQWTRDDSTPFSSTHNAAVNIHPCGTAFNLCLGAFGDDPRCWHALAACRNTGLPTIFPGGFVGRR